MDEKALFLDWMELQFPGMSLFFDDFWGDTWNQSAHYTFWLSQGKPSAQGTTLTQQQAYDAEAATLQGNIPEGFLPEGTTYSTAAAKQQSQFAKDALQTIGIMMMQVAGIPESEYLGPMGTLIMSPSTLSAPEIADNLTPEQVEQLHGLNQQYEAYFDQAIGFGSLAGLQNLETEGPEGFLTSEQKRRARSTLPTIPTPNWLPQLVPGLTAGAPLELRRAKVPSAQMWNTLSPTQQQMFGGFVEATGGAGLGGPQTFSDVLGSIQQGLPRQRTKTARWQPALQR